MKQDYRLNQVNPNHPNKRIGGKMIYADIEYSKKLKDYFKDSEWWWVSDIIKDKKFFYLTNNRHLTCSEWYPALTTDMLLEIIRDKDLKIQRVYNGYEITCPSAIGICGVKYQTPRDKSLPNALSAMTLWLIENNLLE